MDMSKIEEAALAVQPHRGGRRRRKKDLIELTLFSYVRSQCNLETHNKLAYCTSRNCHFLNLEALERLLKSARKSIQVAMYQFSVHSLCDAIVSAKERHNVDVQIIVDSKMRLNQGSAFVNMVANGEYWWLVLWAIFCPKEWKV